MMSGSVADRPLRCHRCGRLAADPDNYCAECGQYLRDPWIDERLLLALVHEQKDEVEEARRSFERSLEEGVGEVSSIFHLALIRKREGDQEGAEELLRQAREFIQNHGL